MENIFQKMIYFAAETQKGRWDKTSAHVYVTLFKITFRSRVRKKEESWFQIYSVLENKTVCICSFVCFVLFLTFLVRALRATH